MKEGSLAIMERAEVNITDNTGLPEMLDRNYLCKVTVENVSVWRILCLECRNGYAGFRRVSISTIDCEDCGRKVESPAKAFPTN